MVLAGCRLSHAYDRKRKIGMDSINEQRSSVVFGICAPRIDKNDSTKIPVTTVSVTSAKVKLRTKKLIRFVPPNVIAGCRSTGAKRVINYGSNMHERMLALIWSGSSNDVFALCTLAFDAKHLAYLPSKCISSKSPVFPGFAA